MNSGFSVKSLVIFFAALTVAYLGAFYGCESWRHRRGPWEIQFLTDAQGRPALGVVQTNLNVQATIAFPDEHVALSNLAENVRMDSPQRQIPFGKLLYADVTVLPGVVTLDLFGHSVELLPRTLIVNRRPIPWQEGMRIDLWATNKPVQPLPPPKDWR